MVSSTHVEVDVLLYRSSLFWELSPILFKVLAPVLSSDTLAAELLDKVLMVRPECLDTTDSAFNV